MLYLKRSTLWGFQYARRGVVVLGGSIVDTANGMMTFDTGGWAGIA